MEKKTTKKKVKIEIENKTLNPMTQSGHKYSRYTNWE